MISLDHPLAMAAYFKVAEKVSSSRKDPEYFTISQIILWN